MNREQARQRLEMQPCRQELSGVTMHTIDSSNNPLVCTDCKKRWDCSGENPLLLSGTPDEQAPMKDTKA